MKKVLFSLLLVAAAFAGMAQKTINDPNAEKRNVSGFHGIEVGGGIDLYLSQGDEAVAVSASEIEHRDKIKTEVVNGVLKIYYKTENGLRNIFRSGNKKLKAYVSVKNIDWLSAGGGSDVHVDGTLKSAKLNVNISGGSDFKGKVETTDLKFNASGGSDVHVSGTAKNVDIDASGGSDFKGFDLTVETCQVDASGGSDVSITATKELNADTSGGSDVHYKGSAVIRNIKTSGGGSIRKSK